MWEFLAAHPVWGLVYLVLTGFFVTAAAGNLKLFGGTIELSANKKDQ
jgi:hypothetical protein